MSRESAKAHYTKQPGDPDEGFITASDAQAAIDDIYDDMSAPAVIAEGSVTSGKIAADAVGSAQIATGAVGSGELATDAVTSDKIADGAVSNAHVASDAAIAASKVAGTAVTQADTGTVTNGMLAGSIAKTKVAGTAITAADTGTVTGTMIAAGAVDNGNLAANAVNEAKIASGAVTTVKIADDAVTSDKIADNAVTAAQIAANAVGASELADNAVDTAAIAADAVTADKIANDTITAAELAANSVGTSELANDSVTAAKILDGTITANEIQNASITGAKLVNDTITATQIAANAVGSSELADNAVDTAAIADGAVTSAKIADGGLLRNLPDQIAAGERLMREAVWWIDAAHSSASGQSITNLGWGGVSLAARAGSSASADSNDPRFLDWNGDNYIYLPGAAGNYLSVPDQTAFDLTGDLDIRVKVALDDWTPSASQVLLAKRATTGQTSYSLRVFTGGALELAWSPDGTTGAVIAKTSTAVTGITDGEPMWVRATLDVDNGASGNDVKFYTSEDGATWTQLGSTVTTAGVTSVYASTSIVEVGSRATGASDPLTGKVYRAVIRDSIGGSPVLDIDTALVASGSATSFAARTNQTVTIHRGTSGRKTVAVTHPVWLFGTDDYLETADFAVLDFDASNSFTTLAVCRVWATPVTGRILRKGLNSSGTRYGISTTTANELRGQVHDGTTGSDSNTISFTYGDLLVATDVVDSTTGNTATFTVNGAADTPRDISALGSLANSEPLMVGTHSAVGSNYAEMELVAAAVFRRALTSGEVTALESYFAGRAA